MRGRTTVLVAIGAAAVVGLVGTAAVGQVRGDDTDTPITGVAHEQATRAALDHMGEGRVTGTEVGDEESLYEVEVTLADGREVDVQLDADFAIVGTEDDGVGGSED